MAKMFRKNATMDVIIVARRRAYSGCEVYGGLEVGEGRGMLYCASRRNGKNGRGGRCASRVTVMYKV